MNERGQAADGTEDGSGGASHAHGTLITYFVWRDGELVPPTAVELEWILEREREREAHWRLREWQEHERLASAPRILQRFRGVLSALKASSQRDEREWPRQLGNLLRFLYGRFTLAIRMSARMSARSPASWSTDANPST